MIPDSLERAIFGAHATHAVRLAAKLCLPRGTADVDPRLPRFALK